MTECLYPPSYDSITLQYRFIINEGQLKNYIFDINSNVIKSIKEKLSAIIKSMNITNQDVTFDVKENCLSITFIPICVPTDAAKVEIADIIQEKYNKGCVKNIEIENTLKQDNILVNIDPNNKDDSSITEQEANEINGKISNIDLGSNIKVVGYWWNKDTDELLLTLNKGKKNRVIPRGRYDNYKGMFKRICANVSICSNAMVEIYPKVVNVASDVNTLINRTLNISLKLVFLGIGLCALIVVEHVATNVRVNRKFLIDQARFLKLTS